MHDFKNRNIKELKSIKSDVIEKAITHGYHKTLNIIKLDSEISTDEILILLDISNMDVQRLVAMCHLMKLPGVKDIRASLYYDSGLRSLDDFRTSTLNKIYETITEQFFNQFVIALRNIY